MLPRLDLGATALGVAGLTAAVWTAFSAPGAEQALTVPALFVVVGLLGPVWSAARFTCRLTVAVGALHSLALALSALAPTLPGTAWWHTASQLLFVAGFGCLVPLAAGYPDGPAASRWWIVPGAFCLVPVLAALSDRTPAVLASGSAAGEATAGFGPIAAVLPMWVADAAVIVFALPAVAVAVAVTRMVRGGRELRGRLTLPLAALAAFAVLVLAGSLIPPDGSGLATALFLVAAPLLPVALVAGSRPVAGPSALQIGGLVHASDLQLSTLTPREREVLDLMAQGHSNPAIGRQLHISVSAVEKHVTAIFGKLDLRPEPERHRRVAAVVAYLRAVRD